MKKNTYLQDIQDTLGEGNSSENLLSIAKKIKSSQKKAFPSQEFKHQLADKLSNVYMLHIESEEKPRFSLLQMIGAFASFIFIAGSIFSFYHMRELSEIRLPESMDTLSIPQGSIEMKGMQSESAEIMISDDMSSENESSSIQESNSDQSGNRDIAPRMMRVQETQQETPEIQAPNSSDTQQRNIPNSRSLRENEDAMSSSMMLSDEAPQDDSQVNTFSSLYFQEDQSSQDFNMIDFAGLCESYGGAYNFENQTCTLMYGTICEEYDENTIFDCYQRDNSKSR